VPAVTDWIEPTLLEIKACLDQKTIPASGERCEFCPYREACGKKLLQIHNATKAAGKK
jgi:CRISPR/Cas system-associated exonuclease Cas4 (RecB family)